MAVDVELTLLQPGSLDPSQVLAIYTMVKAEGLLPWLFWFQHDRDEHQRGDERSFLKYCDLYPSLLVTNSSRDDLYGVFWWVDPGPTRTNMMVCFRRGLGRAFTVDASRQVIDWAFRTQTWNHIWGQTPWHSAVKSAGLTGAKLIGTIPDYIDVKEKTRPLYFVRWERDADKAS